MRNYYKESLTLLEKLHKTYPSFSIARNISTATADYGDIWGMTNKEFLFALQKYETELSLDEKFIVDKDFIKQIEEDGLHIEDSFKEEEEEY